MSPRPDRPTLRHRLSQGESVAGAIVRMPCEDVLEMLGVAGIDFVIVDCEHGPADVTELRRHITIADLHGVAVLVRTGEHEPGLVLRALDQGAEGVVVPHVDSAADAARAVRAAHYPPIGERGFATYPRAGRFGTADPREHQARLTEQTLVVAMIESPAGVAAAEDVLSVAGIDAYLVGAADLAASSGPSDPSVAASLAAVHEAGQRTGKSRCDIVSTHEAALTAKADGSQLVTYNLAAALMGLFHTLLDLGGTRDEELSG